MNKKTLFATLAASTFLIGTWAWAQQGGHDHQPAPPAGQAGQPGSGVGPGQPAPQGGTGTMMMGPGQPGMHGMMMGAASPFERPLISEVLGVKARLGLTAEQEQKLRRLRTDFEKESIRRGAEIQVAEVDLRELVAADPPDLAKIEAQVKRIAALQGELRFARIKVLREGRAVLSKDQWQRFEALPPRGGTMGPGMGRGMMMGSGGGQPGPQSGPGSMMMGAQGHGMMGHMGSQPGQPGMHGMSGMMMGGHGQQGGTAPPVAAAQGRPSGKDGGTTRTDGTGPVAVSATLLPPAGDRVVFQLKLDTHSVDLDAYKLETGVVLRNDRGESAPPVVESPAGSGHHRTATLAFPASLARGGAKYLELVVRDLGGAQERVLRWKAPFPAQ